MYEKKVINLRDSKLNVYNFKAREDIYIHFSDPNAL